MELLQFLLILISTSEQHGVTNSGTIPTSLIPIYFWPCGEGIGIGTDRERVSLPPNMRGGQLPCH